jgi:hypothetical protein
MTKGYKTFLESYKHKAAKEVLADWLRDEYTVKVEGFFGHPTFSPDVTTFTDGHVEAFWEVVHKHCIDGKKLGKMQHYCYELGIELYCYEVSAEWILCQTEKPERIEKFTYKLF